MTPDGTLNVGAGGNARLATWDGTRFQSRQIGLPDSATVQAMLCATDELRVDRHERRADSRRAADARIV